MNGLGPGFDVAADWLVAHEASSVLFRSLSALITGGKDPDLGDIGIIAEYFEARDEEVQGIGGRMPSVMVSAYNSLGLFRYPEHTDNPDTGGETEWGKDSCTLCLRTSFRGVTRGGTALRCKETHTHQMEYLSGSRLLISDTVVPSAQQCR